MNKLWCAAILAVWMASSRASADSLRSVGIKTNDKTGCALSDGKTVIGSTIHLMADAYGNHPKLKDETILEIITAAIKVGCNLHEANPSGLSPLNSAILLNQPVLVRLLLESGANRNLKISGSKAFLTGKDSFGLYEILKSRKDMAEIGSLLERHQ
ncbi:hypothetical protein J2W49_001944 [Hydrogenophaga palleronii]|uniref:Ankyrin repeat domain-containing protein n=1 Tax=Hydrogenophaga palleronii TaxID=65655 RepID=A0ABU1WL29_9BURK|nr:hypothetical protein [Hydrogenophaga palleronii]MDR7149989.1 hypothetical protein [Hydrogenophaga palleronii]